MKRILLSLLACGMCVNSFAQIELPVRASIIAVDKTKNTVYAMKIDAGNMISFSIEKEDIKKFQSGKVISIRFDTKKVTVPPEDERIAISDLSMPLIKANEFSIKIASLDALLKSPPVHNKVQPAIMKMSTIVNRNEESGNLIKVCCEEGTANGFEFMIPAGMSVKDLERTVYIYNDLAFTDQNKEMVPALVFPVSGHWIDSTAQIDTTNPRAPTKGWEQGTNKKVRPNTAESEKWVITPVSTMKGVLGRLDINFPADAQRDILIYQQADNKFLRSVSRNDKIYDIAPGQYRFTITNVPVDNVPIQKGHETRIKAGFLNVVSEGNWHLYNDTKEEQYTSDNKPKKIILPVGNYQLKLGTQFYPVVIKDGETVEL